MRQRPDLTPAQQRRCEQFTRTGHVRGGVKGFDIWACDVCGALVDPGGTDLHIAWHGQR